MEINVATNTISVSNTPLWFFIFPSKWVCIFNICYRQRSGTFLCQSWNSSPSKSLSGCDHTQLKQYFAIFLFFSFLKVVDSHFLSFSFPLFLSASHEDPQNKCNRWSYLQIYKLKEKKYYGWQLSSLLQWKHTWTFSIVRKCLNQPRRNTGNWTPQLLCRMKKALRSDGRPPCPIPCICPLGLPAAAGSPAWSDILSHISSTSWLVPAGIRGRAC